MGLLNNQTNVTIEMIENITKISSPEEFFVKANQNIYGGVFFLAMLWLLYIILVIVAQKERPKYLLQNMLYPMALVSVLAIILRAVEFTIGGVAYSLITDHQMWIFPIITIILAGIVWATKDR